MKRTTLLLPISLIFLILTSCGTNKKETFSVDKAKKSLDFALVQYDHMFASIDDKATYPRSIEEGETYIVRPRDWTSGFFPGSLWYLYEYSKDDKYKSMAMESNAGLEVLKTHTGTHDLGFMLYCSFGNGLGIAGDTTYKPILIEGAYSLASRYDSAVGCIKSWDWGARRGWQYPVIVDNMMNLEYLFWAAQETGDQELYNIAESHANTTLTNHFREDFSSFHVVDYDSLTGDVLWKGTHQGYADESAWARGQAWGLYGYTMSYRETKNKEFLQRAESIANFILEHPNLPEDFIPYWDFNAPNIPDEERDASAGAIIASALIELGQYVGDSIQTKYFGAAENILASLSSSSYLAEEGTNNNFILKHSVGSKPEDSEVNTPLNYADYYFIEALLRYIDLNE